MLEWILWLAVAFAFILFVLAPIAVWMQLRIEPRPNLEPVDRINLQPEAEKFFSALAPAMEALGFTHVTYMRSSRRYILLVTYQSLWVNRACGHAAVIAVIYSCVSSRVKVRWLDFQTELANGVSIQTDDGSNEGMFFADGREHTMQFPQIHNPQTLYKLHLWHERQFAPPEVARYLTPPGREVEDMQASLERTMRRQVEAGLFKEIDGDYCPTLGGAFMMTWMQMPPILQMRLAGERIRARRMLAKALGEEVKPPVGVSITDVSPYSAPVERGLDRRWS